MNDPENSTETIERQPSPPPAEPVSKSPRGPLPPVRENLPVWDDEKEQGNFLLNQGAWWIVGVAALALGAWFYFRSPAGKPEPVRKAPETVVRIQLPPPPPPLPPPPKIQPPPPKDEKRMETPVDKPEPKPVAEKPKPAEKAPEDLGTSIKGGPGMAGLSSGRGNGMIGGTGNGKGGGGGSMGRWYVGQVVSKVTEVMRANPKTRHANLVVNARVWLDASGRITRAELADSSGDAAMDDALRREILLGVQLTEPPPRGMRMPIPLRLTARRPN